MQRRNLDRHVARNHAANPTFNCEQCGKSYSRSGNLEMHKRTCTAGVFPEFTVQPRRRALGGASGMYAVDMQEEDHLSALQGAVTLFQSSMSTYHRDHRAYKFQMAVDVVFHKAVDPAVITQPPVTLTSEMVVVYAGDAPTLEDINRQLLNLVEIYEHNQVESSLILLHFN